MLEQEKHEKDENVKILQEKLLNQEEVIAEQKKENKKMEEVVEMSKNKNNVSRSASDSIFCLPLDIYTHLYA